MPAVIRRLTAAGLRAVDYSASSLAEAARHEPDAGVYTVSNTLWQTQTLLLDAHLDRLEDSARREGMPLRLDRARLRAALRQMILDSGFGDTRFRISAPAAAPDSLLISIEPHQPPAPELIDNGVSCRTARCARRNPAAKSSDWMRLRRQLQADAPADCYEIILVDAAGHMLEGATSNFYAIIDGQLRTADAGILHGISRRITLWVCQAIAPIQLESPRVEELPAMAEAFISSSSRGIIPVKSIDGKRIGKGTVGEITRRLWRAYQRWVADNLEAL